jgi:hypothetical protein
MGEGGMGWRVGLKTQILVSSLRFSAIRPGELFLEKFGSVRRVKKEVE